MPKPTNDVERVFDMFLHLTSEEQKEFRTMLRGREWEGPPEQMPLKPGTARAGSHKRKTAEPKPDATAAATG
jgi:hypothetical protein